MTATVGLDWTPLIGGRDSLLSVHTLFFDALSAASASVMLGPLGLGAILRTMRAVRIQFWVLQGLARNTEHH